MIVIGALYAFGRLVKPSEFLRALQREWIQARHYF
jgi:hypothetical protein